MQHPNQIVKLFTPEDLSWSFDGGKPHYNISHADGYSWQEKVNPYPCYAHDVERVEVELARLQTIAPLPFPLLIAILSHEFTGGTNGFYREQPKFKESGGGYDYHIGQICLCGKVIPIMPAMTRYLVSHEYGHGVEDQLQRMYVKSERLTSEKDGALRAYYTEHVRPECVANYGPGKWHSNVGELFANDFRILVSSREAEFWPHPGFSHPTETPAAIEFWKQAQEDLLDAEKNIDLV
jgi:hypothetical protein